MPSIPPRTAPHDLIAGLQSIHDTGAIRAIEEPIAPRSQPAEGSSAREQAERLLASALEGATSSARGSAEVQQLCDSVMALLTGQVLEDAAAAYPEALARADPNAVRRWLRNQAAEQMQDARRS